MIYWSAFTLVNHVVYEETAMFHIAIIITKVKGETIIDSTHGYTENPTH